MATQRSPKPQPARPALTTERILTAAVAFADEHGVEALTMRRVADQLDSGVMSLYNHVANKEDMLVGMVDLVAAAITPPTTTGDWRESIRLSAANAHEVLLAHQWAPGEWSLRMPGPARLRFMNDLLAALTGGGLSSDVVYHGYHAVTMHIVGFTLQQIGYQRSLDGNLDEVAGAFLAELSDDLPFLAEHVRAHLSEEEHGDDFGVVLGLILDGLDRANRAG